MRPREVQLLRSTMDSPQRVWVVSVFCIGPMDRSPPWHPLSYRTLPRHSIAIRPEISEQYRTWTRKFWHDPSVRIAELPLASPGSSQESGAFNPPWGVPGWPKSNEGPPGSPGWLTRSEKSQNSRKWTKDVPGSPGHLTRSGEFQSGRKRRNIQKVSTATNLF